MRSHGWLSPNNATRTNPCAHGPRRERTRYPLQAGIAGLAIAAIVTFSALSLIPGSAAAAPPSLAVRLDAEIWESNASSWATLAEDQEVRPGDRILYTVRLENSGDQPAASPMAIGPVPVGTVMAPDTATASAGVIVEYSLDGGSTFSSNPTVTVVDPDGTTRSVPAPIDRYTTLRWTWDRPLEPGATRTVSYQVTVR